MRAGEYKYTTDLLELEAVAPATKLGATPGQATHTAIQEAWEPYLSSLPDQRFAAFVRRGLRDGFRIGVDRSHQLKSMETNMSSALANPEVVDKYIANEVKAGTLQAVMEQDEQARTHCNPIGMVPKNHQPGKFRLIVNLSAPEGSSVNDAISSDLASVKYTTVRQAAIHVAAMGKGALLAKLDLHSAYRKVPVHQADQNLLGIRWKDQVFQDHALPFGLRSAPKLFSAIADALAWAISCEGVSKSCHYLDDFLFWAERDSPECAHSLQVASRVCCALGLPPAPGKTEGPSTRLTFLGIKLARLRATLYRWQSTRNPTKRQLQSLIGVLKHAASVIRPGHLFTRNLIEDMKRPRGLEQRTRLTPAAKADLAWWRLFAEEWNGTSFLPGSLQAKEDSPVIISDASGSWGCGVFVEESQRWFQLQWPPAWSTVSIAPKELVPVIAASLVWGHEWFRQVVIFKCDNMAVVRALNSMSAHDPALNRLLTLLFFIEALLQFEHKAEHIAGKINTAADALSRNKLNAFFSIFSQAPRAAEPYPPALLELLFNPEPNWTSQNWRTSLRNCLQVDWLVEQKHHIPPHRNVT